MKRILFVCTGNTCRSPLAEGLLRHMAAQKGLALEVRSAGVAAIDGVPMATHTKTVLRNRGIEEEIHAESVKEASIEWADLILTMTASHKISLAHIHPEAVDKIYTLKEYVRRHIPQAAQEEAEVEQKLEELKVKQALSESLTEEEQTFLEEWSDYMPDDDILDPFGGSEELYEATAQEIEALLQHLVQWLSEEIDTNDSLL